MATTPEYDLLVEKLMGHKVTKLTQAECDKEVAEITEGSFTAKGGEVFDYSIATDGNTVTITGTDRGAKYLSGESIQLPEAIQPKPYTGKRRGRPKGSKNKPKAGTS